MCVCVCVCVRVCEGGRVIKGKQFMETGKRRQC